MSEPAVVTTTETDPTAEVASPRPRPLPITVSERPEAVWPQDAAPGSAHRIHVIASTAVALTAAYLLWRVAATITPASALIGIPLLVLEFWSLASLAVSSFTLWDLDSVGRPEPIVETSRRVAVLIPAFQESHRVLMPTLSAATRMRLATQIIVLDDGHRGWLAGMCDELGIEYRARIAADHDTATQLNVAMTGIDTDFIVILDPDQVVDRDFIGRTLPHFDDARVALVETPQDAYNTDSFEHVVIDKQRVDGHDTADRVRGAGRNRWNAAEWTRGGAMIRAAAIASIGGVADGSIAYGPETTIVLHRAGWRTVQHDEVLARGRAASDAAEYRHNVGRAAAGDLQVLRRQRPLTGRGLTTAQRISHASTLAAGLAAWRTLGYLLLPPLALLLGLSPASGPVVAFVALFAVVLALRSIAVSVLGRNRMIHAKSTTFSIVSMPARLRATTTLLTGRIPLTFARNQAEGDARHVPLLLWALTALNLLGLTWALAAATGLTPVSYEYAVIAIGAAIWTALNLVSLSRAVARIRSREFGGDRRQAPRIEVDGHVYLDGARVHVLDLSLTGVRLLSYGDVPMPDDYCTMTFTDPNRRPAVVTGTVVGIEQRPHGQEIRIDLESDQTYVLGAILAEALIRRA